MATFIRSSTQLYIDKDLDFKSKKGINLNPGTTTGDAVEFDQLNTAIGDAISGVGGALHIPVQTIVLARTVPSSERTDKMIMLVEDSGLYRYDEQATDTDNGNTILKPNDVTTGAGRWIKISATITDHNLLSNIQGGSVGNYYHLTSTQVNKLNGIEDGANLYVHPTGDGNLHVPANGTVNNNAVLTAGATAGVYTWKMPTTGTVTSIGMTVPTGLSVTPATITNSGTFAVTYAAGYSIPTNTKQSQWDTAYGWGNHAGLYSLVNHNHDADYQPLDDDLSAIANLLGTTGLLRKTAANTWTLDTTSYLSGTKVDSFNTRTGAVTLNKADVEAVLTGLITSHTHNYTNNTGTVTTVSAGNGMVFTTITTSGSVTLGTPSSITTTSTNSTTSGSHTHAITGFETSIGAGTTLQYYRGDKTWQTLNTSVVPEGTNLYFTDARVSASPAVVLNTAKVTNATHTGDVTGSQALTISNSAVTFAKMQNISTQIFLGRNSSGTGNVEALSVGTVKTMLGLTTSNQSTRVYRVTPSGTLNGSNAVFTISANVISGTEEIYKNGILMNAGGTNDYTISYGATTTITFTTAPLHTPFTDTILVNYSI